MQKIVIFDMDGTLIDSKEDITRSINYVREHNHNLPPLEESFVVEAINLHERNLPKLFYNTQHYEQKDRELFEQHYKKQCIEHSYLYDGVLEMLQTLYKHDVKMAVATNAPTLFAKTMLEHLKVAQYFEQIIGADQVQESKPSPQMLEKILVYYKYNNTQDKAWMVGDNSKDIESAKKAHIEAIFAAWGFSQWGEHHILAKKPQDVVCIVGL